MPYLVEVAPPIGDAHEAADALEAAFVHLASALLPPTSREGPTGRLLFDDLRRWLSPQQVDIPAWTHPAERLRVDPAPWDRGEVETNLRQIEVIILALRSAVLRDATDVRVSPTQQAGPDAAGDFGNERWVLEAYGGVNVDNNRKLEKAAAALHRWRSEEGAQRMFFACRRGACQENGRSVKSVGRFCPAYDGGPDGVLLLEFRAS